MTRVSYTMALDVWSAIRTDLQKSETITHLLPSSEKLCHNPFIFWMKKHSSQTNTVIPLCLSCKKTAQTVGIKLTQSWCLWHIAGSKKAFHSTFDWGGGQKIFIVYSHKRHNKAARHSIPLPLRYTGRVEQDRFCYCINESSGFQNLHPLPRHQTHRPRHTGGARSELRCLDS